MPLGAFLMPYLPQAVFIPTLRRFPGLPLTLESEMRPPNGERIGWDFGVRDRIMNSPLQGEPL